MNHKKVASDDEFLEKVVSTLYQVLDSNDERTYVVNIEDKSITIDQSRSSFGVGYSEITTAQQIGVTIENRQQ